MRKMNFGSKIIIFTVSILLFSTVGQPYISFANTSNSFEDINESLFSSESSLETFTFEDFDKLSQKELEDLGVVVDNGFDEFNEEILHADFDVEEAVERLDISTMAEEEKLNFLLIIKEAAALSGTEEVELLEEALIGFFDGDSETFNDIESAQVQLIESYIEKEESEEIALISNVKKMLFGSDKVYANGKDRGTVRVGMYFAGSIFNVIITGVVGGGVSAVKNYIKKKGKKAAAETLSRVATAAAQKMGIKSARGVAIASVIGSAIYVALDYADVGLTISKLINSVDWYPKNEYIDITKW